MEDALGDKPYQEVEAKELVLILILMEDALGEQKIDLSDNQSLTSEILQKSFNFHKN